MKFDSKTYRITESGNLGKYALIAGLLFLAISAWGYWQDSTQFYLAYMTSFVFWLAISLAGLFFTMLHHLTGAKWSIVLRRIAESMMAPFPLMLILFVPLVFGLHDLYHWSHPEVVAVDEILQKKAAYLNTPFFLIRTAFYFLVWIVLSRSLTKLSLTQDHSYDEKKVIMMRKISALGMILFAITITFSAFDWLMSLDAHWFSTIFGVYIFSGAFLGGLTFMIMFGVYLRRHNIMNNIFTVEHYHDLGKLTFGFIIFWAYMAFSQYFLIWYANLPEENFWYLYRWDNSWETISLIIVFGHFVIPFLGMITRGAKRSLVFLPIMAGWIFIMHWVDLYWVVMPTHYRDGFHFSWVDITTFIGIGGLFIFIFFKHFTNHPVVPIKDPALETSINFTNS